MKSKTVLTTVIALSLIFVSWHICSAQSIQDAISNAQKTVTDPLPTGINTNGFSAYVGFAIKAIIGMTGVIFICMIVWSGINWMVSAGDAAKITKSKSILIYSSLGLVIVLSAYIIVLFLLSMLGIGGADSGSRSMQDNDLPNIDNIQPQPEPQNPNPPQDDGLPSI